MRSWPARHPFLVTAAALATLVGTILFIIAWRLFHGWPVVVSAEQVGDWRVETVEVRGVTWAGMLSDLSNTEKPRWVPGFSWTKAHVRIVHAGQVVWFSADEGMDKVCSRLESDGKPWVTDAGVTLSVAPMTVRDLTGDGIADVLVWSYVENDHGDRGFPGFVLRLISLGPDQPHVRWQQHLGNTFASTYDCDGDGVVELYVSDDTFDTWYHPHSRPFPQVFLRWNGTAYEPATGRWLTTDVDVLAKDHVDRHWGDPAQKLAEWLKDPPKENPPQEEPGVPPPVVISFLSDLILRGRGDRAHAWLIAHWPESPERTAFLEKFTAKLAQGRFFPATDALTSPEHRWPR